MQIGKLILWIAAIVFASLGLAFLYFPEKLIAYVAIDLESAISFSEIRTIYGGMELGLACFFVYAAADAKRVRIGLVLMLAVFGGLIFGRLASIALDGFPEEPGLFLILAELSGLLAAALGLIAQRPQVSGDHKEATLG